MPIVPPAQPQAPQAPQIDPVFVAMAEAEVKKAAKEKPDGK